MKNETIGPTQITKRPWNKNKLIGQKSPLKPPQVWAIRVRLQLADQKRDTLELRLRTRSLYRRVLNFEKDPFPKAG